MMEFGKRALNKAQTRLDILAAVYRLSNEANFRDITVKNIAREIGITEMTFFNYLAKKEDILIYMTGIWALDLLVLQHKYPLRGEAAIRRIFRHTAERVQQHSRLMVNYIAYLATNEIDNAAYDVEAADRYLLYPDLPELFTEKIPSGNELLLKHLVEIDPARDPMPTLLHLASCFYGDILIAHTAGLDIQKLYDDSLDLIFGAAGQSAGPGPG